MAKFFSARLVKAKRLKAMEAPTIVKQGWLLKRGESENDELIYDLITIYIESESLASILLAVLLLLTMCVRPGEYIKNWRPRWFQLKSDGSFRGYVFYTRCSSLMRSPWASKANTCYRVNQSGWAFYD